MSPPFELTFTTSKSEANPDPRGEVSTRARHSGLLGNDVASVRVQHICSAV